MASIGKEIIMKEIVGHTRQRQALVRLIRNEKLPSTTLFSGPAGIGKQLVARALSAALLCNKPDLTEELTIEKVPCGRCSACHLFAANNAPDFHFVACADRENWNTANIRELLYSLHLRSFSG